MKTYKPLCNPALLSVAFASMVLLAGCNSQASSSSSPPKPQYPDPKSRFSGYTKDCGGIPGYLDPYHYGYELTPEQQRGACTWYLWVGGDPLSTKQPAENARGNPRFWRLAEIRTSKIAGFSGLTIRLNFLDFVDSRKRDKRFKGFGVLNDPGCKQATKADPYGLWLDECEDPYSSGVMGIRLFPNPNFDPAKWDAKKYLEQDARIEPPYLGGMSCGLCHIALNPVYPPADLNNPKWENLAGAFGNQYFNEGALFGMYFKEDDFLYQVSKEQQAGTSDTSRVSMDFIDNPNSINPIFYIISARPTYKEVMNDGSVNSVPHILKEGADSIGAAGAANRVYVNEGTCGDYRMSLESTFLGLKPQRPFDIAKAEAQCEDWRLTAARMDNAAAYLDSPPPFKLEKALEYTDTAVREKYQPDKEKLNLGKKMFGQHCARCHSSKLPEGYSHEGDEKHAKEAQQAWVDLVMRDDFLDKNFLSDDRRYPIVSADKPELAIGTNAARAMGTNAGQGHLWQNFSSKTYKELPSVGKAKLYNPFDLAKPIEFEFPPGGRGYYRTPSLISLWATAPFLNNNSLGIFNQDPSVTGRMEAFLDAAQKLLWPDKRLGPKSIKVTRRESYLRIAPEGKMLLEVKVPAGTPIKLLANIDPRPLIENRELKENLLKEALILKLVRTFKGQERFDEELRRLVPKILALNQIPDFIEDKGHTTSICRDAADEKISCLSAEEKWALIEFMKTF
jgi:mono/diheme cytochrome c family protein